MSGLDVLAVMDAAILRNGHRGDNPVELRMQQEARAAVAELAKCCDVTIKAFEALGRTNGIVDQLEAHRECERALIEQKTALARVSGGAA